MCECECSYSLVRHFMLKLNISRCLSSLIIVRFSATHLTRKFSTIEDLRNNIFCKIYLINTKFAERFYSNVTIKLLFALVCSNSFVINSQTHISLHIRYYTCVYGAVILPHYLNIFIIHRLRALHACVCVCLSLEIMCFIAYKSTHTLALTLPSETLVEVYHVYIQMGKFTRFHSSFKY